MSCIVQQDKQVKIKERGRKENNTDGEKITVTIQKRDTAMREKKRRRMKESANKVSDRCCKVHKD